MKNGSKYLVALSMVALMSACGTDDNTGTNNVGDGTSQLVSATVIEDVNTSVMMQVIHSSIDANATNAFGYKAVKIRYNTTNQNDEAVVASGLLVIPTASADYQAYRASQGLPPFSVSMINENHGTIFTNAEAPTSVEVTNGLPDYPTAILMAGYAGFAAIIPDYIGYGDTNDITHPYMLKKASVQVSVDMIKASIKYMEENGVVLNYQLYVSGYSQGGYNAMAVGQSIDEGSVSNVNLMGVAPMDGPYSIEDLGDKEIDANSVMLYPGFLAYLANSYAYYYDDVDLTDIVVETNTTLYQSLFDGSHSGPEIHAGLGLTINYGFAAYTADAVFKESFINDYQNNPDNVIRSKFQENKSYTSSWVPKTKVNLIHCLDDEIIPFFLAQNAFDDLVATGADVTLSPIPSEYIPAATPESPFVHSRCGSPAYGTAVKWFNAIRSGDI